MFRGVKYHKQLEKEYLHTSMRIVNCCHVKLQMNTLPKLCSVLFRLGDGHLSPWLIFIHFHWKCADEEWKSKNESVTQTLMHIFSSFLFPGVPVFLNHLLSHQRYGTSKICKAKHTRWQIDEPSSQFLMRKLYFYKIWSYERSFKRMQFTWYTLFI